MLVIKKPKKSININENLKLENIILDLYKFLEKHDNEVLICTFLNEGNEIIEVDIANEGDKSSVKVDIVNIIKRAIALKSKRIAVYHTHPGENCLVFSEDDYKGNRILNLYCKEFGIELVEDGVIDFKRNSYLSMDNNIYKCEPLPNCRDRFISIKNSIIPNFHTLFFNRQGINNFISQLKWR